MPPHLAASGPRLPERELRLWVSLVTGQLIRAMWCLSEAVTWGWGGFGGWLVGGGKGGGCRVRDSRARSSAPLELLTCSCTLSPIFPSLTAHMSCSDMDLRSWLHGRIGAKTFTCSIPNGGLFFKRHKEIFKASLAYACSIKRGSGVKFKVSDSINN